MYTVQVFSTTHGYLKAVSLGQLLGERKASGSHIPRTGVRDKELPIVRVQLTDELVVASS